MIMLVLFHLKIINHHLYWKSIITLSKVLMVLDSLLLVSLVKSRSISIWRTM